MNEEYKSEVDEHSSEWSQITTQLQFSTGQPSLRLINLFRYNIAMERGSKVSQYLVRICRLTASSILQI